MYRVILLLLVILAPQVRSQIVIPRPKPRTVEQNQGQTARLTSLESFKRDLLVLQQALRSSEAEDAVLRRIGEQYRDLEELILEAARQIEPVEMTALMKVARRYGNERHGDELLFQLQVRPMGSATEPSPFSDRQARLAAGTLGMRLFLVSLGVLFVSCLLGYLVIRLAPTNEPAADVPPLPFGAWVSTALSEATLTIRVEQ